MKKWKINSYGTFNASAITSYSSEEDESENEVLENISKACRLLGVELYFDGCNSEILFTFNCKHCKYIADWTQEKPNYCLRCGNIITI